MELLYACTENAIKSRRRKFVWCWSTWRQHWIVRQHLWCVKPPVQNTIFVHSRSTFMPVVTITNYQFYNLFHFMLFKSITLNIRKNCKTSCNNILNCLFNQFSYWVFNVVKSDVFNFFLLFFFQRYDFTSLLKIRKFQPEFMFRCVCNYDKCNSEANFQNYLRAIVKNNE